MIFPDPIRVCTHDAPFRDCKWCKGKGCLACQQERKMAYEDAFPGGPKPLASISFSDAKGMADLAKIIGSDGIAAAREEAARRVDSLTGLSRVLLLAGDAQGPDFRNSLIADETTKVLTEKLAALGHGQAKPE